MRKECNWSGKCENPNCGSLRWWIWYEQLEWNSVELFFSCFLVHFRKLNSRISEWNVTGIFLRPTSNENKSIRKTFCGESSTLMCITCAYDCNHILLTTNCWTIDNHRWRECLLDNKKMQDNHHSRFNISRILAKKFH